MKEKLKARFLPGKEIAYIHRFKKKKYKYKSQKLSLSTRLLPNGRPVTWGTLFASTGDQISEQVAQTGALLDSSSLSCKYDPTWN